MQSLDVSLFRFINQSLSNPVFDRLMPWFSDIPGFGILLLGLLAYLIVKGGVRGRIFALVLVLGIGFCDGAVCNTIKHAVGRLRPFYDILDANVLIGRGSSGSMPSSHAANWFAATMISFLFYPRSIRFMLPLAILVSFSRIYNGVHYPSDVIAGAIIGAGTGFAVVWALNGLWEVVGAQWFPIWHAQMPTLLGAPKPLAGQDLSDTRTRSTLNQQWLRVGYLFIALLFVVRLGYLAAGKIGLTEDEAYQWLWSKNIDLSYYSKPPLIAYTQFMGTHIWGDTMFGVRFFSPIIAAILSLLVLRFMAREFSARAGVVLLLIVSTTILTAVGATLMTIDPLSVLFWTAAMVMGWRASRPDGTTGQWLWVGLWMGLGFLSKYTNLFQLLSWALLFVLWPPARKHLRRPGPYLALVVNALCALPVLIWNAQHDWITVEHVASDGRLGEKWHFSLRFLGEFLGSELGLLNPVFFVGMIWAAIAFWRGRTKAQGAGQSLESSSSPAQSYYPLEIYLFSMGAPVFICYLLFTLHSRVLPNWIAPSVLPLFCLMVVYFGSNWDRFGRRVKPLLGFGIGLGLFVIVLAHDTDLTSKIIQRHLPSKLDVLHRARGWEYMAALVGRARTNLEAREGKPTFIIGDHYGITSLVTFYLPEAKKRAQTGAEALVYYKTAQHPENQFYFWPGYTERKGQNAIYMHQSGPPKLAKGWFQTWWNRRLPGYEQNAPVVFPHPDITKQFESVTNLGTFNIVYKGRVMRHMQLFECRNLK